MSYDLFFLVPEDRPAVSIDDFAAYFGSRPWYQLNGAQALYGNENTGVYFVFDHIEADDEFDMADLGEDDEDADDDADAPPSPPADGLKPANVSLNVNYFRPHIFGLEAAPEIEAFVREFDLRVDDPQFDGMGRGEFSVDHFLQGWNAGNRFAYQAITQQMRESDEQPVREFHTLPTAEIERVWRWNHAAADLQTRLGEGVFVPHIRFIHHDGGVCSFVVWGDAIGTVLPRTDYVILVRDELAPRRGLLRRKQTDMSLVPHDDALRAMGGPSAKSDHVEPYFLYDAVEPPAPVLHLFESTEPMAGKPQAMGVDAVLNQELMDEALAAADSAAKDEPA